MDITLDNLDFIEIRVRDHNGEVQEFNLEEELRINEYNLADEMYTQPQKYVYFTSLLEKVRADKESTELMLDKIHADLYEPSRSKLHRELGKNPTKDQIESEILQNEEYLQQRETVNIYNAHVRQLQYVVKAFETRKDMLVQLSADQRRQQEYEQAIKAKHMNSGYEAPSTNQWS